MCYIQNNRWGPQIVLSSVGSRQVNRYLQQSRYVLWKKYAWASMKFVWGNREQAYVTVERKVCVWWDLRGEETEMLKNKSEEVGWSHVVNCLEIMVKSLGFTGQLAWNPQVFLKGSRASQPVFLDRFLTFSWTSQFCPFYSSPSVRSLSYLGTSLSAAANQAGSWGSASLPLSPRPHGRPDGICQWLSKAQRSPSSPAFHFQL